MTNITNKAQAVQWGANVLHRMQTYLWIGLKGNIYIPEHIHRAAEPDGYALRVKRVNPIWRFKLSFFFQIFNSTTQG